MKEPLWTLLLASALALGGAPGKARAAERGPNIVLVLADDLGWSDVGFNGRREWSTPNLDRLAAQGTIFTRFYTAAVVCAPSRAALLTGKYTIHDGVSRNNDDLPREEVTIAEALKARGYATALFGKWHHGKPRASTTDAKGPKDGSATSYVHPMDQGFDEFFGFTDATHAWEKFPETLWDGRQRVPVSGYADDLFTERAVNFLKRHRDRPFFLYLPYIAAHFHVDAPEDEVALHRGKFAETDPTQPVNATYAALATRLDKNVGKIARTLEELGLSENTLFVFTSDHGATFEQGNRGASNALDSNRPFRGQKRTLWEGGVRVPAFAVWPGHAPAGVSSPTITHMTDLFPTFLAAAGASPDPTWKVDGLNMLPVWTGRAAAPERTLFWEWRSEGADQLAALRGDLKLVITRGGRPELYDVVKDPAERRDLAPQFPEVAKQLNQSLQAWLKTEVHP
ncbi:MAG: sulfatase-like hydrolase/transferase [Isosphaeraceae bacterium]|nr:sulfatase-like hydrolase/transferase [Isosphaeraceae bacterium]